jgi:hypothetical protein
MGPASPAHSCRRSRVYRLVRGKRVKIDASVCASCTKKLHHAGPKVWRALGSRAAIRCLDCRMAFCPNCARKHFAPVQRTQDRLMRAVEIAAVEAIRETRDSCFVAPARKRMR